jgi:dTMP kinase
MFRIPITLGTERSISFPPQFRLRFFEKNVSLKNINFHLFISKVINWLHMKFVVIEGLDGAGKSTQIGLLRKYLDNKNISYRYFHFPRTDSPVFGDLISMFLRGDLGELGTVNPYLIALIYAGDRHDAKETINAWLKEGHFVIADRYVSSNIAFQCAKIRNTEEQVKLKNWILKLEYEYYRIPRPDIELFLDVPFSFTEKKLKVARKGEDRKYLNGQTDIHEQNLEFQKEVRKVYLELTTGYPGFFRIDCSDDRNGILSPGDIFEKITKQLGI